MSEPESEKGADFLARCNITDVEDFVITVSESAGVTVYDKKSTARHSKGGTIGDQRPQLVFDRDVHRAHTIDVRSYLLRTYTKRSAHETYYSNYPDYTSSDGRDIFRTIECSITYSPAPAPEPESTVA